MSFTIGAARKFSNGGVSGLHANACFPCECKLGAGLITACPAEKGLPIIGNLMEERLGRGRGPACRKVVEFAEDK